MFYEFVFPNSIFRIKNYKRDYYLDSIEIGQIIINIDFFLAFRDVLKIKIFIRREKRLYERVKDTHQKLHNAPTHLHSLPTSGH